MNNKKFFFVFSHNRSRASKIFSNNYCGHYALQKEGCVLSINADLFGLPNHRVNWSVFVCGDIKKLRTNP